jgi:hypothetical protein
LILLAPCLLFPFCKHFSKTSQLGPCELGQFHEVEWTFHITIKRKVDKFIINLLVYYWQQIFYNIYTNAFAVIPNNQPYL